MKNPLLELLFLRATVQSSERVGVFRRMRLTAPGLRGAAWTPGQQVRLDAGPGNALAPTLRTYSVWSHEDDAIELYLLVHGDGPGSRWAEAAVAGTSVLMSKPKGDFVVRTGGSHLFIGEETASVAFGAMLRALPADQSAHVLVDVPDVDSQLPLARPVQWLVRGSRSAASSAEVLAAARALELPAEPGQAYLAGEARTIQSLRHHLVAERGWPRRSVHMKPFWTPGKRGME
jgi:NADPH-dependent ferric siderophore reductase